MKKLMRAVVISVLCLAFVCPAALGATLITGGSSNNSGYNSYNPDPTIIDNPVEVTGVTSYVLYGVSDNLVDDSTDTVWIRRVGFDDADARDREIDFSLSIDNKAVSAIWLRMGNYTSSSEYAKYARPDTVKVELWYGMGGRQVYRYSMLDMFDPNSIGTDWNKGYQKLMLPNMIEGVFRIDIYVESWTMGTVNKNMIVISDVLIEGGEPPMTYVYDKNRGITAKLVDLISTRSGPGTQYDWTERYLAAGDYVQILSRFYNKSNDIWWLQVEFMHNGKPRRLYAGQQRVDIELSKVPVESSICAAVTSKSVTGYYGPGTKYSSIAKKVPANVQGTIIAYENGYAQFDYLDTNANVMRRVWVDSSILNPVSEGWDKIPEKPLTGVLGQLIRQISTRSGPGQQYDFQERYLDEGDFVQVLSRTYNKKEGVYWVQVEFMYNGKPRRLYCGEQRVDYPHSSVPVESVIAPAVCIKSTNTYYGPGTNYGRMSFTVPANMQGNVYAYEKGYAQFDYLDEKAQERRRVWVDASALTVFGN